MRSEIAQPCIGPSESALRIRRSSVPCGRSSLSSPIGVSPLALLQDYKVGLVEAQEERVDGWTGGRVDGWTGGRELLRRRLRSETLTSDLRPHAVTAITAIRSTGPPVHPSTR